MLIVRHIYCVTADRRSVDFLINGDYQEKQGYFQHRKLCYQKSHELRWMKALYYQTLCLHLFWPK